MSIIPQGFAQGTSSEVEVNTRAMRLVARPIDYSRFSSNLIGQNSVAITQNLAANTGALALIYGGDYTALVRRITIGIITNTTAFTAGVFSLQLFFARWAGAAATGGVAVQQGLTNPHDGKLRTRMRRNDFNGISPATAAQMMLMPTSGLTLPAGLTAALDATPLASIAVGTQALATQDVLASGFRLWNARPNEHPIVLGMQDGLLIRVTPPVTGVWNINVTAKWDEVPAF
jgi:hypothetical protein